MTADKKQTRSKKYPQSGLTLVEMMVALAVGSFLIIGAVQVYSQSRQAFVVNESIAEVQETAQFAMDTIEADLRMVSNYGRNSLGSAVEGSALPDDDNPKSLPAPAECGAAWALNLSQPLEGANNGYGLPCAPKDGVATPANSDTVTTRRATVAVTAPQNGRLQIQSSRTQGELFADGAVPASMDAATSETHNLLVNTYYVAADSALIPGVPTLRRKTLSTDGTDPSIEDLEVAPGVENMQLQFGIDVNADNTVDRYVNPGHEIITPGAAGYIPGARVMTARIWLLVRSLTLETGLTDTRVYQPGDVDLGTPDDGYRRMLVSKTILLRNARS